jgi:serine/threonine protein phosphatase PrpC
LSIEVIYISDCRAFINTNNDGLKENIHLPSGSTAVVSLIYDSSEGKKVIVANVGDSRAVLVRKSSSGAYEAVRLSYDHRATDRSEQERIYSVGATVQGGRVEGRLQPSRCFGDYDVNGVSGIIYSWFEFHIN